MTQDNHAEDAAYGKGSSRLLLCWRAESRTCVAPVSAMTR